MTVVVGFSGCRRGLTPAQRTAFLAFLPHLVRNFSVTEARHGCCTGGDEIFHDACAVLDLPIVGHPTSTDYVGDRWISKRLLVECDRLLPPAPPLSRNRAIVDVSAHFVATPPSATPSRSGTWSAIHYARRALAARRLVSLHVIYPDGELTSSDLPSGPR